jgi:hypothetical protein
MTFRLKIPALAVAAMIAAAQPAWAKTYDFTFDWNYGAGGPELVGSFTGTDDGVYVHGISNLSLSLENVGFTGPLTIMFYSMTGQSVSEPAVSFDVTKNNFFISNSCSGAPGSYSCANTSMFLMRQNPGGVFDQVV